MNIVSGAFEIGGYIPIVGSFIGVGRMAVGGTTAAVGALALITFTSQQDEHGLDKSFGGVAFGMEQYCKGMIEVVPFVKIMLKIGQIWNHSSNRWALGIW